MLRTIHCLHQGTVFDHRQAEPKCTAHLRKWVCGELGANDDKVGSRRHGVTNLGQLLLTQKELSLFVGLREELESSRDFGSLLIR